MLLNWEQIEENKTQGMRHCNINASVHAGIDKKTGEDKKRLKILKLCKIRAFVAECVCMPSVVPNVY